MDLEVSVERSVVDSVLSYAQILHPKESILLLNGKADKSSIVVDGVQIPPLASHGSRFSSFPFHKTSCSSN